MLPLPGEEWQLKSVWEYVSVALEGEQLLKEGATREVLSAWSEQSVESGRTMGWTAVNFDAILAGILREFVGPIHFRPAGIAPALLRWNGGAIPRLATSVFDERDFERLPILADALEEAGCTDAALLGHLRGPGPHLRGCWAVDLLLGNA